jgi:hypothetical protein
MQQLELITVRGSGLWGGRRYDVELVTSTTTWTDSHGKRSATKQIYGLNCPAPAGDRDFPDESSRASFIAASFVGLELRDLDPPEVRTSPEPFASVLDEQLSSIEFVSDYVQLRFDSSPLSLYVWPRIHCNAARLGRESAGYTDALLALIGRRLIGTDELLDLARIVR